MAKTKMTHQKCVEMAAKWLGARKASDEMRCKVVLKEMVGYTAFMYHCELVDVLGIWDAKNVVSIECKASRSDFVADKKKHHDHPTGNFKMFACPYDLISPEELPEKWGLLYVNGRGGKLIKRPSYIESKIDVTPILCDIIINGAIAGVLNSSHKRRPYRMWSGKAVIL